MEARVKYLAAGGNRHPAASDWDIGTGLLAYGAGRNLAIWKPQDEKDIGVRALIPGHSGSINAVKFLSQPPQQPSILLTGSADKTIRVWRAALAAPYRFDHVGTLSGHSGAINCIATLHECGVIVSGGADGTLKIWHVTVGTTEVKVELLQSMNLKPRMFALSIALYHQRDQGHVILAVGGTRNAIQIYTSASATSIYTHKVALSGHESWIRSLDFNSQPGVDVRDVVLASASQDKFIRLWRFQQYVDLSSSPSKTSGAVELDSTFVANKSHGFTVEKSRYAFNFEALLLGHEDWVYSVKWHRSSLGCHLLSASSDNTLGIWEPEPESGVWVCTTRLGEISTQKGSTTATGSTGGFWAGFWLADGESVVSLGRTGSWCLWQYEASAGLWSQKVGVSGHTGEVRALAWSTAGTYLLSSSADQTTRLHAPWKRTDTLSWHELARPQIHGYELNCIATISESQFISGAEEKLLRVFNQPRPAAELLHRLSGGANPHAYSFPEAASMPVLGLSNKAMDETRTRNKVEKFDDSTPFAENLFHPDTAHDNLKPPMENSLSRHTLWPESEKLYGHGFEISALSCSHDGTYIATACKATSVEHAVIRLYSTDDWHEIKPSLKIHTLTVTDLEFSDDDSWLLSVGRDRQWSVFERLKPHGKGYRLSVSDPKCHARMILGASWAPSRHGRIFATASRDKTIKIWKDHVHGYSCRSTITATSSVTDVSFEASLQDKHFLLGSGLDTGEVFIHVIAPSDFRVMASLRLEPLIHPCLAVTKISWQPFCPGGKAKVKGQEDPNHALLAISSEDYSVRVVSIDFNNVL